MTRLQQRKLHKVIKKRVRADHRTRLYLIFYNWVLIRKQKDRRRRRTIKKLWKADRLRQIKNGGIPLAA